MPNQRQVAAPLKNLPHCKLKAIKLQCDQCDSFLVFDSVCLSGIFSVIKGAAWIIVAGALGLKKTLAEEMDTQQVKIYMLETRTLLYCLALVHG